MKINDNKVMQTKVMQTAGSFWEEFKAFAFKGNIVDLAVAVVIGAAFSKIVTSLVEDLIMPLVGILIGGHDFASLKATVGDASITYGNFIQSIVDFFLVALSIFIFLKIVIGAKNKLIKQEEIVEVEVEETKPTSEELLAEIRDLLKQQNK